MASLATGGTPRCSDNRGWRAPVVGVAGSGAVRRVPAGPPRPPPHEVAVPPPGARSRDRHLPGVRFSSDPPAYRRTAHHPQPATWTRPGTRDAPSRSSPKCPEASRSASRKRITALLGTGHLPLRMNDEQLVSQGLHPGIPARFEGGTFRQHEDGPRTRRRVRFHQRPFSRRLAPPWRTALPTGGRTPTTC
jgi:hypothetical protein